MVAAAAHRVAASLDDLTAHLLTLFAGEIAPAQHDDQLLGLLAASTEENLSAAIRVLEHGLDPRMLEVPPVTTEYARRLAQRGIPVSALLRAYRLGHAAAVEVLLAEVAAEGADPAVVAAASVATIRITTAYVDSVSELAVVAYETELQTWSRHQSTLRASRIHTLLHGDRAEVREAETAFDYRLGGLHVAAMLWFDERGGSGDDLVRLEHLATATAAKLDARYLFAPEDGRNAVVWFGPSDPGQDATALAAVLAVLAVPAQTEAGAFHAAIGNPGTGLEGFRDTHRQAGQAKRVMLAAGGRGARVTPFAEVGAIALLCSDLNATRRWVVDTLGPLAADDENAERLRETVRVFLGAGSSYTAAAEVLSLHKNSVQYRVQRAEALRGRPFKADRSDAELALRAAHLLGAVVLRPAEDRPGR